VDSSDKKKIKWLLNQPDEIILQAIKLQRDLYFKLRSEINESDPNRLTLISLIKAAGHLYNTEHPTAFKNPEHNLEQLRKKILDRIERHQIRHAEKIKHNKKRESKKKNKVKELMVEIKIMREQDQSYRSIADYIQLYHKLKLHPTYISKLFHNESNK